MAADQPQLALATESPIVALPNSGNPTQPLQLINIAHHNIVKLISTNYLSWKLQMEANLVGYDLYKYIDGSHTCPSSTVRINIVDTPNPDYLPWVRQDKLLFGALVGSISSPLIPLIQCVNTSREAWLTLANTYARPSRGHIKQIKDQIKHSVKGSQSISEYMQFIKCRSDELAALGKPMDHEDLIEKILDGLDDDYRTLVDAIEGRDTPISFDELHEKLLNRELSLKQSSSPLSSAPITANVASNRRNGGPRPPTSRPAWPLNPPSTGFSQQHPTGQGSSQRRPPRPYLGKCQGCHAQGHTVAQCPLFRLIPTNTAYSTATRASIPHSDCTTTPQWQPKAHMATASALDNSKWLLDSGASHHVTADLNNLSLHAPYDGPDDIVIGDGTWLHISHTGSTYLQASTSCLV